jgi:cytochrome c oxidase subunit 2
VSLWDDTSAGAQAMAPQNVLDPAAEESLQIDLVLDLMLWVCGTMFVLVMLFLVWSLWRARRGHAAPALPKQERGLGVALGVWSALITLGLFVLTLGSFLVDRRIHANTPPDLTVEVTGNQWWWQVQYVTDDPAQRFYTANELHLPLGRTTLVELRSNDVIHSLWIPNLNGKTDLIPGRVNRQRLTPRKLGRYRGECGEFCGLQHAKMALDVIVDTPEDFETWRRHQLAAADAPQSDSARDGQRVFMTSACVMCHTIRGTDAGSLAGPELTHFASRATLAAGVLPMQRGSLAAWLADPQQQKPGTNMPDVDLEPDALNALVDYLMSLR